MAAGSNDAAWSMEHSLTNVAGWLDGQRFADGASRDTVVKVNRLEHSAD